MCHLALLCRQSLCLAHTEQAGIEAKFVVEEVKIHDTRFGITKLANVAAEENGKTGLEHLDAGLLESIDIDVDIADSTSTDNVSKSRD